MVPPVTQAILVTLDGVRWQEVFLGVDPLLATDEQRRGEGFDAPTVMPYLHRWVAEGGFFVGAPGTPAMWASGPSFVSLPGYLEMFTGVPTRCATNACDGPRHATFFDQLATVSREPGDVAVISSWEPLSRAVTAGGRGVVISAGRHHLQQSGRFRADPALFAHVQAGRAASSYPGRGDFRPDAHTTDIALRYLQRYEPRLLHVGLGEPDEYAHRGDYASYLGAIRAADRFVHRVRTVVERQRRPGPTLLMVTTDHGRAHDFHSHGAHAPESGRVWLAVLGARFTPSPRLGRRPYRLADVASTIRAVFGLPRSERADRGCPLNLEKHRTTRSWRARATW